MALTVRDYDEEQLKKMSQILNCKTQSGTIKKMISNYLGMTKKVESLSYELCKVQEKHARICNLIKERQSTKTNLDNLQSTLSRLANNS